jgi:valyl-tRNA synthetase
VTEEVWSWWQEGSIHRATWPTTDDLGTPAADQRVLDVAAAALAGVRGAKSVAKVSQRTAVTALTVRGAQDDLDRLTLALDDVRAAGKVTGDVALEPADAELAVDATLEAAEQA